jgi:hypothetical protein
VKNLEIHIERNKKAALLNVHGFLHLARFDSDDRFAFVRATVQAHTMRFMILATTLAHDQMLEREFVMCAALITAGAGVFTFWQRTH